MRIRRIAGVVALMMAVANAAFADGVKTQYDKGTNFAAYKTFRWIKEPNIADPLVRERVMRRINGALIARDLQLVAGDADLGIAAYTATMDEPTLHMFYEGVDGGWRGSGVGPVRHMTSPYEIGTLVVDVFDADTKALIWRGTSSRALAADPRKNADDLHKAVAKMFRNFPPPARAKTGFLGWMVEFLAAGLAISAR